MHKKACTNPTIWYKILWFALVYHICFSLAVHKNILSKIKLIYDYKFIQNITPIHEPNNHLYFF